MMQRMTNDAVAAARAQGRSAVQALAEQHLPLVAMLVKRFPRDGREPEELYQQGCIGLMKAIARFEPDRGTTFSSYAAAMILGEMRMLNRLNAPIHVPRPERELHIRIHRAQSQLTAQLSREPTITELAEALRMDAAELAMHMDGVRVTSADACTGEETSLWERLADPVDWTCHVEMDTLISRLPFCDQQLIRLRCFEGRTQAETARLLGTTQLRISRREQVIRRQLRREWYGT